jgi:hypothetical protein
MYVNMEHPILKQLAIHHVRDQRERMPVKESAAERPREVGGS